MSAVQMVNPNADIVGSKHTMMINCAAAKGLQNVLKSNLGPRGTVKMLVSGAGEIKLTKDGCVLLNQMSIQHPTAAVIARTATAQDDMTGDGTTSTVLFVGELMHQAERYLAEGLHPRVCSEGFELAREETLAFLERTKQELKTIDRELLVQVARTALRTKLPEDIADHFTEIVVDSVLTIRRPKEEVDLHMVEIMHMRHKNALDSKFIDGLVLDHGARHPDMPKRCENAHILILNVSLEYEKSEVNAGFFYKTAEERAALTKAERKFTDDRVWKIVELKKKIIGDRKDASFVIINMKGIDPISLDILHKNGIVGLRRAKKRNMERLAKACGGYSVESVDDLSPDCLGYAKLVYEHTLGEDKFTFVEGTKNPTSCTVLVRGPNDHTIAQLKEAVRDGLRAVKNVFDDNALLPGAGAFELAAHLNLLQFKNKVSGRAKLGVQAFADALLVIPKTLASNAGHDPQTALIDVLEEAIKGNMVGVDLETGKAMLPDKAGVWDNFCVKKHFLHLGTMIAMKLLMVDEIIRAGKKMGKGG